jgi:hypothetical protein
MASSATSSIRSPGSIRPAANPPGSTDHDSLSFFCAAHDAQRK